MGENGGVREISRETRLMGIGNEMDGGDWRLE